MHTQLVHRVLSDYAVSMGYVNKGICLLQNFRNMNPDFGRRGNQVSACESAMPGFLSALRKQPKKVMEPRNAKSFRHAVSSSG